jgi:hypothetical protein
METKMFKKGEEFRSYYKLSDEQCLKMENLKLTEKQSKMTEFDKEILKKGHSGQGEYLNERKYSGSKK